LLDDFALSVGDAAHNVRSALDHIVFAFANRPLTPSEERSIQFPITSKSANFQQRRHIWLPGVPLRVRSLIEQLQPYHRRKWPDTKMLGQLQAIDNWDKHRRLSITANRVKRCNSDIAITGDAAVAKQVTFSGRMRDGKVLAPFEMAHRASNAHVMVRGKIVVVPIFDAGMPKEVFNVSAATFLMLATNFIEGTVIPLFEGRG
jgi:hypothetical protein